MLLLFFQFRGFVMDLLFHPLFSTHTKGDDDVCNDEGTAIVPGFHGLLCVPCAVGTLQVASPHYEAV